MNCIAAAAAKKKIQSAEHFKVTHLSLSQYWAFMKYQSVLGAGGVMERALSNRFCKTVQALLKSTSICCGVKSAYVITISSNKEVRNASRFKRLIPGKEILFFLIMGVFLNSIIA